MICSDAASGRTKYQNKPAQGLKIHLQEGTVVATSLLLCVLFRDLYVLICSFLDPWFHMVQVSHPTQSWLLVSVPAAIVPVLLEHGTSLSVMKGGSESAPSLQSSMKVSKITTS